MKRTYIYLAGLILCSLSACKKELTQKQAVEKITLLASQKKITKQNFTEELLPIVNDLYAKDSIKFRIIHHIALKAQKEKRNDIFEAQVKNIKNEMKYISVE